MQEAGANSEDRFNRVVLGEATFRQQAKAYLQKAVSRSGEVVLSFGEIEVVEGIKTCFKR